LSYIIFGKEINMPNINRVNIYFNKRKGVLKRALYFSAGFVISLGFMAQSYPQGRISKQVKFYDLKEERTVNPLGKGSGFIHKQVCVNL